MEKDGPLDGRKYNKNNKGSQMGQVTPKKYYLKKVEMMMCERSFFSFLKISFFFSSQTFSLSPLFVPCDAFFPLLLPSDVNFTNILRAPFSYENVMHNSYSLRTVWLCKFLARKYCCKSFS